MRSHTPTAALLVAAVLLTSCSSSGPDSTDEPTASPTGSETSTTSESPSPTQPTPTATATPSESPSGAPTDEELAALGVNELGRVLVAEWHEIQDTTGDYKTELGRFREQLTDLYERGYRPISIEEFVSGTFPIPAGTSPVLLTFDDSYREHLFFDGAGEPDPDSVVGILQAMEREDPTWRARASFAFYWPVPFRESGDEIIAAKFRYLVEHGFDLSNHSHTHDNLAEMSSAEAEENIALSQAELQRLVPEATVRSITLPFGMYPEDPTVAMSGDGHGVHYEHDLAFMVGWMPTRSPHHAEFNPKNVMRVPAHGPWGPDDPDWDDWLDWLDEPERRFVSDGDPEIVTYPANFADVVGNIALPQRTY